MISIYSKLKPYLQLIRLDKPTGYLLLFFPCLFGLFIATKTLDINSIKYALLFFIGSIAMRSSGCIINDLWDKNIDSKVERTKNRPIASGQISVTRAIIFLILLLIASAFVAWQLPTRVFAIALASMPFVIFYPICKRFTYLPQLFLGITFNFGVLMGYVAITDQLNITAFIAYLGFVFWTLGYDTIYAHQDKTDDKKIGVKSAALLFGKSTKQWVGAFYIIFISCLAVIGLMHNYGFLYFASLSISAYLLSLQLLRANLSLPSSCAKAFKSNIYVGFILAVGALF